MEYPYRLTADLHTHTYFSHGKGSIEDNVREALRRGLTTLAVTDHGFSQPMVGLTGEKFLHMRRIVDELNRRYDGQIRILLGVEANIVSLDGRIDVPRRCLPLVDILNLGLHSAVVTTSFSYLKRIALARARHSDRAALARVCTEALVRAVERWPVDILTHPGFRFPVVMEDLAPAAARTATAIEINASHRMPGAEDIRTALAAGCVFAIGSDAHRPEHVGRFGNALALAAEAGVPPERIVNDAACEGFALKAERACGAAPTAG